MAGDLHNLHHRIAIPVVAQRVESQGFIARRIDHETYVSGDAKTSSTSFPLKGIFKKSAMI
jgi:hypothetical protein